MSNESQPASVRDSVLLSISSVCAIQPHRLRAEDRLREDLGMDSVTSMELLSTLAERLRLDVEMEEAMAARTVGDVVALAERHLLGAQASVP
ncbi:MAG: acyl carrier protein [Deltaproteobacteria bacterium]|nr:acyl carrier protein [Deltaproteobacteria bacterium]